MAKTLRLAMIAAALWLSFAPIGSVGAEEGGPTIDHAWARATPGAARTGVVYFTVESPTADRLVGVASPVAAKAELHAQIDKNGNVEMRPVEEGVVIAAGQPVELKPGGLDVMLIDLKGAFKEGDSFPLFVTFETAGTREATVKIERLAAMGAMDHTTMDHGAMSHDTMDHAGMTSPMAATSAASKDAASAEIGGPFTLVDQDGRTVTDKQYRGKWLLVYFGYTHCPDACPIALNAMAVALDLLDPPTRGKVQVIFVTVDPERDTPAVMKEYVGAFEGANFVGLTGTPEQVAAAEAAHQIHVQRHERGGGEYTMNHTAFIHIMGPDGRFLAMVYSLARPEQIAERLAQLVR